MAATAVVVAGSWWSLANFEQVTEFSAVKSAYRPSELLVVDRRGRPLHESRRDLSVRRLEWVGLDELPADFLALVLLAEDRRFFKHPGVDLFSMAKAVAGRLVGRGRRGASTISMQVADLIAGDRAASGRRGVLGKARQVVRALRLETRWDKREILEAYLNLVHFRGEMQGVAAAAQGIFSKAPFGLTPIEGATLAALIRSPNAKSEVTLWRACNLLDKLHVPCAGREAVQEALARPYRIAHLEKRAPHVAKYLTASQGGGRVRSTIDLDVQLNVHRILAEQVSHLADQNLTDAAAVVLDNRTGEVLAYVGNIGARSGAEFVDGAAALRQAGSTLKPFFYARAMERRLLTPATLLNDTPIDVAVASGIYRPNNFDRQFRRQASARQSLANSLNIPAVHVLELIGVDDAVRVLGRLGLNDLQRPDFYGPSLALGSADVRLIELANAYRALANGGWWTPARFGYERATPAGRRVLTPEAAFLISDILSDRGSRGATFGWESALGTRFWSAVKTGTSKDMRDNWCIGYSQWYTVGVWAGNLSGAPMWNVSGVQGAAPAWLKIMNALHERGSSTAPSAPEGVVRQQVQIDDGPSFQEWFIAGTEPPTGKIVSVSAQRARLLHPADQTMVALDPDIPPHRQRVVFEFAGTGEDHVLRLNGQRLARANQPILWRPVPGRHQAELVDREGRVVDRVRFEVRGSSR